MTLVSELVLTRNQLLQLARTQENSGFTAPLQRLSHITSDLQEGVMKTRMQPIGNAWNKLPRLVRDLALELDKKIELDHARRRHRARPPGAGADQGSADAHGAQLRRPRAGNARPSGAPPASRRPAGSRSTPTTRAATSSSRSPMTAAACRVDRIRAKVLANGLATEAELAGMTRRADPALHLPRRLLHRRRGHRRIRPRRRHGRGEDQHREDRRHGRAEKRRRARARPSPSRSR